VADTYPNNEEGKKATDILSNQIPILEKLDFSDSPSKNWKILYKVASIDSKNKKLIEEKVKKLLEEEKIRKLNVTFEPYADNESFIIINGSKTKGYAIDVALILKNEKVVLEPIVISNENYRVIQIKKNLKSYLK